MINLLLQRFTAIAIACFAALAGAGKAATIAVEPLYAPLDAHRDAASSLASANS
jgi:hypothetical protein